MTSLLERGCIAVDQRLGASATARWTRRVEPHRAGGLVWTLETESGVRWLRLRDDELEELIPAEDDQLPIASTLQDLGHEDKRQILTWRPGRRIVVGFESAGQRLVAKGYRSGRSKAATHKHQIAYEAARRGLLVPRLVEHERERSMLTFEHACGSAPRLGNDAGEIFYRVGYALREFQRAPVPSALRPHDRARECEVIDRLAQRVEKLTGGVPTFFDALRDRLRGHAANEADLVLVHGDFHDRQLLVHEHGLTWIDFDSLAAGEPMLDLANLTAHLSLRGLQGVREATHASVEAASEALLEGYDAPHDPAFAAGLRFYQASTFLRLSLLYTLRPRWSALPPRLSSLAERCLDDVEGA